MTQRRQVLGAMAGLGLLSLAGCGGGQAEDSSDGQLRLVNLSDGYDSLDLYVDDSRVAAAIAAGAASGYTRLSHGTALDAGVTAANGASVLASSTVTLGDAQPAALIAWGWAGALNLSLVDEDLDAAASGKVRLRVLNLAPDAGALDVFLTGTSDSLSSATAVASSVEADAITDAVLHASGSWRLRVTAEGDRSDLRLDVDGVTLNSTSVVTLVITPGSSGVLVHAHTLVQGGSVSSYANVQGRARLVASVSGSGVVSASVNGTSLAVNLTSPGIGSFQRFTAGSAVPVTVTVGGTAVTVDAQDLPAGGDYTLLVWGTADAPQVQVITEDLRLPTGTSQAGLRVLHAVNGLTAVATLAVDFSAKVEIVAQGAMSDWAWVSVSSSMRLEVVTSASSTTLFSDTDVTLVADGLYTMFLLGDAASPQAALRKER